MPALLAERSLGFLVADLARLLRRHMDRRLQSLGLTQAQWRAIVHLARNEGMTQATLADRLEIQPISLTRLVDRMESAGWLERRAHPLDRRAVQLYLTARSQPILAEMNARGAEIIAEATRGVTAGAQKQLLDTLERIKSNLLAAETTDDTGTSNARRNAQSRSAR
jgi:MarR family transcriptional regulator, transcriptional regulator for hemolysin